VRAEQRQRSGGALLGRWANHEEPDSHPAQRDEQAEPDSPRGWPIGQLFTQLKAAGTNSEWDS
jgi:hypothetical protein